jgi:hypothetical protein
MTIGVTHRKSRKMDAGHDLSWDGGDMTLERAVRSIIFLI